MAMEARSELLGVAVLREHEVDPYAAALDAASLILSVALPAHWEPTG